MRDMKKPLAALALAVCSIGPAMAAETIAIAPAKLADVTTLEEVVVTGDLDSLIEAQKAVVEAEDRFYARYNELNKDDRYDVTCHMEIPRDHPSRLTKRVCEPRFIEDGTNQDATRLQAVASEATIRLTSTESIRMAGTPELRRRTLELIKKDPELLRALLERARLQEHYDALRKEKFKGKWFAWD